MKDISFPKQCLPTSIPKNNPSPVNTTKPYKLLMIQIDLMRSWQVQKMEVIWIDESLLKRKKLINIYLNENIHSKRETWSFFMFYHFYSSFLSSPIIYFTLFSLSFRHSFLLFHYRMSWFTIWRLCSLFLIGKVVKILAM